MPRTRAANWVEEIRPNGPAEAAEIALHAAVDRSQELLYENPEALLAQDGEQVLIPVIDKPSPLEFFRTHPTLRMTLAWVTPNKGKLGSQTLVIKKGVEAVILKHKLQPFAATLYPIVIDGTPPSYALVRVRLPDKGNWDAYNLSKKIVLDKCVDAWGALRLTDKGYIHVPPHPDAIYPEPIFPDYDTGGWLERSVYAAGLVIENEAHEIFRPIQGLR